MEFTAPDHFRINGKDSRRWGCLGSMGSGRAAGDLRFFCITGRSGLDSPDVTVTA